MFLWSIPPDCKYISIRGRYGESKQIKVTKITFVYYLYSPPTESFEYFYIDRDGNAIE